MRPEIAVLRRSILPVGRRRAACAAGPRPGDLGIPGMFSADQL